jgi:hypothetical protein
MTFFTYFFFFLRLPQDVEFDTWNKFLAEVFGVFVGAVFPLSLIAVVLYSKAARAIKIRYPSDLFKPYTPMLWLLLSWIAGLITGTYFSYRYHDLFPDNPASGGSAVEMGLYAIFWASWLCFLAVRFIPEVTPDKFKYRPISPFE